MHPDPSDPAASDATPAPTSNLDGLSPLGLLDDVLASGSAKSGADWQPPPASELEPCLPGYRDFAFI
ncbi:MAG: hypothetical protein LDL31_05110, partial [Prosthecobacter sp.]|nr:hypothetical protein [Prosthecobacter sp.]